MINDLKTENTPISNFPYSKRKNSPTHWALIHQWHHQNRATWQHFQQTVLSNDVTIVLPLCQTGKIFFWCHLNLAVTPVFCQFSFSSWTQIFCPKRGFILLESLGFADSHSSFDSSLPFTSWGGQYEDSPPHGVIDHKLPGPHHQFIFGSALKVAVVVHSLPDHISGDGHL